VAAKRLLGHPGPAAGRGSAGFTGNGRWSGSSSSVMESLIGHESRSGVVWDGAGNGVSSNAWSGEGGLFKGRRGGTRGWAQWQ
jgi:hypothetical protein